MGTNFYIEEYVDERPPCSTCGRSYEDDDDKPVRLHIGKSSAGWAFALRVYRHDDPTYTLEHKRVFGDQGPYTYEAWMALLADTIPRRVGCDPIYRIRDEYGDVVGITELMKVVHHRNGTKNSAHYDNDFLRRNSARVGKNNLLFSVDQSFAAKHFTYYYYTHGEFS